MKKIAILMIALIFGLWGCTKDSMPDPSNQANGNLSLKSAEVQKYDLTGVKMQNHVTQNPMVYMVTGNCNHLGLLDPQSTLTMKAMWPDSNKPNPAQPPYINVVQIVEIILIGADGSSLHFSGQGTFSFATGYGETKFIIDGGTGRFEGASGWYNSTSQFDFASGTNSVSGNGGFTINKK